MLEMKHVVVVARVCVWTQGELGAGGNGMTFTTSVRLGAPPVVPGGGALKRLHWRGGGHSHGSQVGFLSTTHNPPPKKAKVPSEQAFSLDGRGHTGSRAILGTDSHLSVTRACAVCVCVCVSCARVCGGACVGVCVVCVVHVVVAVLLNGEAGGHVGAPFAVVGRAIHGHQLTAVENLIALLSNNNNPH
jgi:hypothetical protein